MKITPSFVALVLNGLILLLLLIAFLIGYIRGTHKSVYRLTINLLVIVGGYLLFPYVAKFVMNFNYSFQVDTQVYTSLSNFIEVQVSNLIVVNEGVLIKDTNTYALFYGVFEMGLRLIFVIVLIVLNFTICRVLFGLIYIIIKPPKRDKQGIKRRISKKNRLFGGLISCANMLFFMFFFVVPLAGISSIGTSVGTLLELTTDDNKQVINLALGEEVLILHEPSIDEFEIKDIKQWASVHRQTITGVIFSIKINGVEIDNHVFDKVLEIKYRDESIKIRKEIEVITEAVLVIKEEFLEPFADNNYIFSVDLLDQIDGEKISQIFTKLSELQLAKIVIPVGTEYMGSVLVDSGIDNYIDVTETIEELSKINLNQLLSEIGEAIGAVVDLLNDVGYKPSDLVSESLVLSDLLNNLIEAEDDKIQRVFTSLANIHIVNSAQNIIFAYLENTYDLEHLILIKPKITISDDDFLVINDVKSNIKYNTNMSFDDFEFSVDENDFFVINDISTNVSAKDSILGLDYSDISLKDEIINIGAVIVAFKNLEIASIGELTDFINGNSDTLNLEAVTWEKVDNLFASIFNFKLISNNIDNVYVVLNNVLPNEYRNMIKKVDITSSDLTAIVMAAKVLFDSGIYDAISKEEEIDFVTVINEYSEPLIDNLLKSKLISENITTVANAAIMMLLGEAIIEIPDLDWETEGRDELGSLLKIASVVLKYQDEMMSDFLGMSDEALDEIFDTLEVNYAKSKIISSNLNNLISYFFDSDSLGFIIEPFETNEEWNETELKNMLSGLRIMLNLLKDSDEDLFIKLLSIDEADVDTLLSSRFIKKTIIANIYPLLEEGQALDGILVVNIDKNDPAWDNELNIIFKKGTKLFNGVTDFNGGLDEMLDTIIKNISELTNNLGGSDDEVGEILSSIILVDTLVNIIKDLEEQTDGVIIVGDDISWVDNGMNPGELRIFFSIIKNLLIDEDGNVLYSELTSGDVNKIVNLFLNASQDVISEALDSKIMIESIKKMIIDLSKDEVDSEGNVTTKAILVVNEDNITDWKSELLTILRNVKIVLVDDGTGNYFSNPEINYSRVYNLTDAEIEDLLSSSILTDTIVIALIELDEIDTSSIMEDIKKEYYKTNTIPFESLSRQEQNAIITKSSIWKNSYNTNGDLIKGEIHQLLTVATKLVEEDEFDINKILDDSVDPYELFESRIILDTFFKTLEDLANVKDPILIMHSKSPKTIEEAVSIIKSAKIVLKDDGTGNYFDNVDIDMDSIYALTEAEIEQILKSKILTDTIVITLMNRDEIYTDNVLNRIKADYQFGIGSYDDLFEDLDTVVQNEIITSDPLWANTYDSEGNLIKGEIHHLLFAATQLMDESEFDLNRILDDEIDLNEIFSSVIICDTFYHELDELSAEEGSGLYLTSNLNRNTKEAINFINAVKKVLKDDGTGNYLDDFDVDMETVFSQSESDIEEIIKSRILFDTIILNIIDQESIYADGVLEDIRYNYYLQNGIDFNLLTPEEQNDFITNDDIWPNIYDSNQNLVSKGEVHKLLYAATLLNNEGEIDIELMLDDDNKIHIFESRIILDTFYHELDKLSEPDDSSLIMSDHLVRDKNQAIRFIDGVKIVLTPVDGKYLKDINIDMDSVYNLTESEIDTLLLSQILKDTIVIALIDNDAIYTDKIVSEIELDYTGVKPIEELTKTEYNNYITSHSVWAEFDSLGNLINEGELHKLLFAATLLIKDEKFDVELLLDENTNKDDVFASQIILDTFFNELDKLSEPTDSSLIMSDHLVRDKNQAIKFIDGVKIVLTPVDGKYLENVTVDMNNVYNLTETEIDTLLQSQILKDTIVISLIDNDAVYTDKILSEIELDYTGTKPIEELTDTEYENYITSHSVWAEFDEFGNLINEGELHKLLFAATLLIKDEKFDVELLLDENTNKDDVFASQIILDTFYNELDKLSEPDDSSLIMSDHLVRDKNQAIKFIDGVKLVLTPVDGKYLENVNVDMGNVYSLTETEIDTLLQSQILKDTIVVALIDNDAVYTDKILSEVELDYTETKPIEQLTNKEYNNFVTSHSVWAEFDEFGNLVNEGELHKLLFAATLLIKDEKFDIELLLDENTNKEDVFASQIILDTFYHELDNISTTNDTLIMSTHLERNDYQAIKFIEGVKIILNADEDGKYLSNVDINMNKLYDLEEDDIETLLKSQILNDTIVIALIDNDAVYTDDLLSEIKASYSGSFDSLTDQEKDDFITLYPIWANVYDSFDNLFTTGEIHKLLRGTKQLVEEQQFEINKIMADGTDLHELFASRIILDTFYFELDKISSQPSSPLIITVEVNKNDMEAIAFIESVKLILVKDDQDNYLTNVEIDYSKMYNLSETDINRLLLSRIVTDTIIIGVVENDVVYTTNIEKDIKDLYYQTETVDFDTLERNQKNLHITKFEEWHDRYENTNLFKGEVYKLLVSSNALIDDGNFDIDKILDPSTNLNVVFDSRLLLDSFYYQIDELASNDDPVIFIHKDTPRNKDEAIYFVGSIKVIVGENSISNLDSSEFNFDTIITLSDPEIDELLRSQIVKFSASKQTLKVLRGDSLIDFIETDKSYAGVDIHDQTEENEEIRLFMVSDDLGNLIRTIRDLGEIGIDYNQFSYNTFNENIKNADDPNAQADLIADTLANSLLIVHSLKKLMTEVLSTSALTQEQKDLLDLDIEKDHAPDLDRNYWLNEDINGNGTFDEDEPYEIGELRKMMRLLTVIEQFSDGNDNSGSTAAEQITVPLKQINNSMVTQKLIPSFMDTALSKVESWCYNPKPELTKEEWDLEIDILGDIIVNVNDNGFADISDIDINSPTLDLASLETLLKLIARSRYLDIDNIRTIIKAGVDDVFNTDVTLNPVYTGDDYDQKVLAWNGDETNNIEGEIDKLMTCIELLRAIDGQIDISDNTLSTSVPGETQGETNARNVGKFLDACKDSIMLSDIPQVILDSLIAPLSPLQKTIINSLVDFDNIDSYEDTLIAIARAI